VGTSFRKRLCPKSRPKSAVKPLLQIFGKLVRLAETTKIQLHARRSRLFDPAAPPILKSSILWPVFIAATNHRGCFPLPDQVSDVRGLRYFGPTRGYLRRALPFSDDEASLCLKSLPPPSTAKRFSSSRFSDVILADKISRICS